MLSQAAVPHVVVTIVGRRGSVPQEMGAKAIVCADGLHWGTVGGGKVEARAIKWAQERLQRKLSQPIVEKWNLKLDLGMTCGGEVSLLFESYGLSSTWQVVVFGVGHVGQALVKQLALLDCMITCVDSRPEWLDRIADTFGIKKILASDMASVVPKLEPHAQVVVMTQGHSTDLPVLDAALAHGRFSFIGVIGSRSKGHRVRRRLIEMGHDQTQVANVHCPVGLPLGKSLPQEIALSIASQLVWQRDYHQQDFAQKWASTTATENRGTLWAD